MYGMADFLLTGVWFLSFAESNEIWLITEKKKKTTSKSHESLMIFSIQIALENLYTSALKCDSRSLICLGSMLVLPN